MPKFKSLHGEDVDLYAPAGKGDSLAVQRDQVVDVPGRVLQTASRKQLEDAGVITKAGDGSVDSTPDGAAYYVMPGDTLEAMPNDATYVELPNGDVRAFPNATWEQQKEQQKGRKDATDQAGDQAAG